MRDLFFSMLSTAMGLLAVAASLPAADAPRVDSTRSPEPARAEAAGKMFCPRLDGDYVLIYQPQPDVYSGPGTEHYTHGVTYPEWRPNDHTFIKGPDGRWHCFGITKPSGAPGETRRHEAEGTAFHAVAPVGTFAEAAFREHAFSDRPKITVGDCGWAPFITRIGAEYTIVGSHLGWATSPDLATWTDRGKLPIQGPGRDPYLLQRDQRYYLYRCAGNGVSLATSPDFVHWTEPVFIFQPAVASYETESPSIIAYAGKFYLFWCLWDKAGSGHADDPGQPGYGAQTFVYCSAKLDDFRDAPLVARLPAHAPEVFQDEQGQWYLSSADYPNRGIQAARLKWEEFVAGQTPSAP